MAKPYLVLTNLLTITRSSQLRISKQIDMQVVQDLATQWIQAYPCIHKKPREACKSSWNPRRILKSFTLTSLEWESLRSSPGIIATQHRSETNGIGKSSASESAVLLQSGLDEKRWADSMECYCYLRNILDLLSDEKTLYERRFGEPLKGPIIPFGSMVESHPTSATDCRDCISSARKSYQLYSSVTFLYAEGIWKGDILVADIKWKRWTHQKSVQGGSMQRKC